MLIFRVFLRPTARLESEFESHTQRCLLLPTFPAVGGAALHAPANRPENEIEVARHQTPSRNTRGQAYAGPFQQPIYERL